jgi:DNA-binding transcriptional ArsR family regulator
VAARTRPSKRIDETLISAVAHPLRVRALSFLTERSASPKEIAAELGTEVGNISYHVRELERAGLIELVDEKKRRGAIEHFYRAIRQPMLDDADWEKLGLDERLGISAWIIQVTLADAAEAIRAGSFDARGDRHLSRVPLLLDEEGWGELVEIQSEALRATLEVRAASAARLAEADDEEGFPATAVLACFETPPKRPPAADAA